MLWISDDAALRDYCAQASRQAVVAVDTEFVWTKTYYARLGLVQLSYEGGDAALVDPLSIQDSSPFRDLMESPSVTKVFHEAGSDLPILHRWCGCLPKQVADTRIAAGFAGMTAGLSLGKLLNQLLGVELAKTETRTDWLQRPLTAAQLSYASEDVCYMPQAFLLLKSRLEALGNWTWFESEMAAYEQEAYYEEADIWKAWRRVSQVNLLNQRQLTMLQEVAAWREQFGRDHDISRGRIVSDQEMIEAIQCNAKTMDDLKHHTKMWSKTVERYGQAVLDGMQRGREKCSEDGPQRKAMAVDVRTLKQRSDRVLSLIRKRSEKRQIDSVLVGSRKDAESLVLAAEKNEFPFAHPLLEGWRLELLGPVIIELTKSHFGKIDMESL